jgi:hypothetical protein
MNNIVFRKPTHIYCSDASEFGIGGYNLISGKAWRFMSTSNIKHFRVYSLHDNNMDRCLIEKH